MSERATSTRDRPAWCITGALIGLLAGGAGHARRPPVIAGEARELDPDALSARELRALPGIGPARALTVVRARWQGHRGGPSTWRALPGIGAVTARAAEEALSGSLVEPLTERAYTRGESP